MKIPSLLLFAASVGITAEPAFANLLSNPGAELGNIVGWTAGGTSSPTTDNGSFNSGINPHGGGYDFLGGTGASGALSQTVAISAGSNAQFANVSFWEQGLNQGTVSDNGYVSLTFLNSFAVAIGTVSSPVIDSHNLTWQQYTGSFLVPVGTASITYTMNFTRNVGSDLDSYFDDNNLTVTAAVPEPTDFALLSIGLAAVIAGVRRSRRAAA